MCSGFISFSIAEEIYNIEDFNFDVSFDLCNAVITAKSFKQADLGGGFTETSVTPNWIG